MVRLIDPSTEEVLGTYEYATDAEVEEALSSSLEAWGHWRRLPLKSRIDCVQMFEHALQAARITLAEMISREMGKVHREALAEIDKCVSSCAALRERFPEWKRDRECVEGRFSVHYESLGPVLAIMPWNFPVWQVVRFAIPALLNGNTILLKHAPNTWGVSEFLSDLFRQAFPHAVFQEVRVDVPVVARMIADARVRGVSLTGSRQAGASVGELAGRFLKPCVLELGGSDAYVILADADLSLAADVCARGRLVNAGQSCVAAKRFIAVESVHDEFVDRLSAQLARVKCGQPFSPETGIGPLARKDLRTELHRQVEASVRQGARKALGGELPSGHGFFYPASLLTEVRPGQAAFDEELFGPVAAVIRARDEAEAFQLANRSRYGLGGAVFSKDVARARELALKELEAGMVFVNDFVRSDVLVPFGGVKDSGLGRELGREGCFEFVNIKTVYS